MLKRITIKQFQCHKRKEIKFDPHLTIIVGPNDVGKSAILRSIRWVCLNRPGGTSLARVGSTGTSVRVQLHNTGRRQRITTLVRCAQKGKQSYILNGATYHAIGAGIPDRVQSALRVAEINFAQQHDPVFWFSLSPGQTARELNKLIDLDTIDFCQSEAAKLLREKKAELKVCQNRIESELNTVAKLRWVKAAIVKMGKIEARQNDIALKSTQMARIRLLLADATRQATRARIASLGLPIAQRAATHAGAAVDGVERVKTLAALVARLESMQRASVRGVPKLPNWVGADDRVYKLECLIKQHEKELEFICQINKKVKKKKLALEQKLGGRCPTCGGILTTQS